MTINPPMVCENCEHRTTCVNVPKQQTYLICGKADNRPCHELKKCPIHLDISIRM